MIHTMPWRDLVMGTLIIFFLPLSLEGQRKVLTFHRLSGADNLSSQNYNYYLFRDSLGFVWISSINGLNRFDGRSVKQYHADSKDSLSLIGENIYSPFFENSSGNFWFSTTEAIHHYDRHFDGFHSYYIKEVDPKKLNEYQVLYLDRQQGHLWVRHKNDLYICDVRDRANQRFVDTFQFSNLSRIFNIPGTPDLVLSLPNPAGLFLWRIHAGQIVERIELPGKQISFEAFSVFFESEQLLWIGADIGLIRVNLQKGTFEVNDEFDRRKLRRVRGIVETGNKQLIIATEKDGLYFFDKIRRKFTSQLFAYEREEVRPFLYPVRSIFLDADQTLWISSPGRGIYYTNLEKRKFQTFLQKNNGAPGEENHIRAITEDSRGRLWCLTRNGIRLVGKDGVPLSRFEHLLGEGSALEEGEAFHILCDSADRIWVGTSRGLFVIDAKTGQLEKIPSHPQMDWPGIAFISQQSDGQLLASSTTSGLFKILDRNGSFKLHPMEGEIKKGITYTVIYEDRLGRRYLCEPSTGIHVFHKEESQLVPDTILHLEPMVSAVQEDLGGNRLWVATTGGLYWVDTRKEGAFTLRKDTLLSQNALNGLMQDNQGRLWASTNHGLLRYDSNTHDIRFFGVSEGLQGLEFNWMAYHQTSDGRFAFGGVNGLNIFDPLEIRDLQIPANPTITRILINDEDAADLVCASTGATNVSQLQKLVLPYSRNTLSFYFSALEYSDPEATQFKYRMKGKVDDHFVEAGTDNFARYANLPPGDHVFEVQASNSDGVWAPEPLQLAITVRPPWYQTWWFFALLILAFLLIVYAIYRYQVRRIEFRRKEAEYKQQEAEYQQQIAEIETSVLRLQMNPHFIFNSMNSISSYILKKDVNTANDYLGRFARLMRNILKFAEQPFIDISTEIELLEQYLDTEKMRFHKEFSYEFKVEEGMDPDDIVLPTMILQPFVENAIWHGLAQKEGKGHIRIAFQTENGELLCSVEDNGVGRKAARQQSVKAKQHESKALSITARRLKLLEEQEGAPASYEIVDLVDDQGLPAGTKIVLRMPVLL